MHRFARVLAAAGLAIPLATTLLAQEPPRPIRFYAHGGVGIGRFVFLCSSCGDEQTALVPSASVGVTLSRIDLDLGFHALGWSHIGDRFTVLTVGTTWRPRLLPFFVGGGIGVSVRQFPGVCSSCRESAGTTAVPLRGDETSFAAMLQLGTRLSMGEGVGLEPFLQLSRLGAGPVSDLHASHLAIGIRLDGRQGSGESGSRNRSRARSSRESPSAADAASSSAFHRSNSGRS